MWTDSYVITTREFGPTVEYGIGVYGLEKNKMLNGQPARAVCFFIDGNDPDVLPLVGDGLLPADIDGKQKPPTDTAIPIVGHPGRRRRLRRDLRCPQHLGPEGQVALDARSRRSP